MMKSFTFYDFFAQTNDERNTGSQALSDHSAVKTMPGNRVIQAIMNYSRALFVQKSEMLGYIRLLMN